MSKRTANEIAEVLGGEAIPGEGDSAGEDVWCVRIERQDGRLVVISETSVDEFYDHESLSRGSCYLSINLV